MLDIGVVIPCYNGAAFIDNAIRSVLAQSRPVASIVVVDDASTDESVAIARSYATSGYPVSVIPAERNGGPATARNIGVSATKEPLVAFLDADDRWEPDHCATVASLLERHPEVVLAFGRTRTVSDGVPEASTAPLPTGPAGARCAFLLEDLLYDNMVPQSAVIVRRGALQKVGGYTDGLRHSEDYDLWLRLAHGHPFASTDAATCIRLMHEEQATNQALKMYTGAWEARDRYHSFAQRSGGAIPIERYRTICMGAFERDLQWAWQSRSLKLLKGVLDLSDLVPGGDVVRRRWTRRMVAYWPLWRSAAYIWDVLPDQWRQTVARWRSNKAEPGLSIW